MVPSSQLRLILALAGGFGLACTKEKPAEPAAIPAVMVMATDFAFQMPDTLTSGVTTFRLMNHGQELHHLVLIRMPEGMGLADFQKMNPAAPPPAGMVFQGGPNAAAPGGVAEATLDLEPGRYAVVCMIPSPDGTVHMLKGMMRELAVVAGANQATLPDPDVTMKLGDYSFTPSPALASGHHVIRIENGGTQWHEMMLVKLEPGKTAAEFLAWVEKPQGPPPGTPLNGASPIAPGQSNTVTVDLEPGEYALFCFLPDAKDGKPHLVHGMMQQISVK